MMKRQLFILLMAVSSGAQGQERWSLDSCINFAVSHNHEARLSQIQENDFRASRLQAVGGFLPSVEAGIFPQYSFGRAVDPETNTYCNVNTFNSGFAVSASIPLFTGLQNYFGLRASKANLLMSRQEHIAKKDAVAQEIIGCYVNVLYYQGTLRLAEQKLEQSRLILQQTKVMAEVGIKDEADILQMEAVCAGDDYEVSLQRGLLKKSLLSLKQKMNLTTDSEISLEPLEDSEYQKLEFCFADTLFDGALQNNPRIRQAELGVESAEYSLRQSRGALIPTISLGAEVSSAYYRRLGVDHPSFGSQFHDNLGECIYANVRIPIFGRMTKIADIRHSKNNLLRAQEQLENEKTELQMIVEETIADCESSSRELQKILIKVQGDSIASRITIRKYEEGLASSIDVKTATVAELESRARLLLCKLNFYFKLRILNYYKGEPLWTEQ